MSRDTLFETVDIWTESAEIEEYISFLSKLYDRIVEDGAYRSLDRIASVHAAEPHRGVATLGDAMDVIKQAQRDYVDDDSTQSGAPRRRMSISDMHRRASHERRQRHRARIGRGVERPTGTIIRRCR